MMIFLNEEALSVLHLFFVEMSSMDINPGRQQESSYALI